jgi:hypothetical protein
LTRCDNACYIHLVRSIWAEKPENKHIEPARRKMLDSLTRRDRYFVGYANAYTERIDQMKRENARWQEIVDKWPGSEAATELTPRIARNKAEIKRLSLKATRIMANVRR